jgi:hypothetical protein
MAAPNFKAIIMVQTVGAATPTFFTTSTAWLEAPSYVRIFLRSFVCQKQTTQTRGNVSRMESGAWFDKSTEGFNSI